MASPDPRRLPGSLGPLRVLADGTASALLRLDGLLQAAGKDPLLVRTGAARGRRAGAWRVAPCVRLRRHRGDPA